MIKSILLVALVILSLLIYIIFRWIKGIDYMKENHTDYKADDWLNWNNDSENENDKNQIQ
jgi:uncharacterized membrane protein